jgi:hypothetical protein
VADLEDPTTHRDKLDDDVVQYIDDHFDDGLFMVPLSKPSYHVPDTCELGPTKKATCTKHLIGSQDSPLIGAFTQEQIERPPGMSPNTLLHSTHDAILGPPPKPKNGWKQNKKGDYASAIQSACYDADPV